MQIKQSLKENAFDFIGYGIERFADVSRPIHRRYKLAILNISAGTLLLLKVRLAEKDKEWLRKNVDSEKEETVAFKTLIDRLKTKAGVEFKASDIKAIDDLTKLRNKIEHNEFDFQSEHADDKICESLLFLGRFCREELNTQVENEVKEWEKLPSINEIRLHAPKIIGNLARSLKIKTYYCPNCELDTAIPNKQLFFVNWTPFLRDWITGYYIRCYLCQQLTGLMVHCPQCGELSHSKFNNRVYPKELVVYCDKCNKLMHELYPDVPEPLLVTEIERFFKKRGVMRQFDRERIQLYLGLDSDLSHVTPLIEQDYLAFEKEVNSKKFTSAISQKRRLPESLSQHNVRFIKGSHLSILKSKTE